MTALILDLPPDLYARRHEEAARQGKPPEGVVREWLAERPSRSPDTRVRDAARGALQAAGLLLAEPLDDGLRARTAGPDAANRHTLAQTPRLPSGIALPRGCHSP